MSMDATTRELIADCLSRIASGEAGAAYDLASAYMGHMHEKDIGLNLAIVEALATLSSRQGCQSAEEFLQADWSDMQILLRRRLLRAGFSDV